MQLKKIKRLAIGLTALWVMLISIGLIFSHSFQDKIIEALTEQAEKHIQAEIHIRKSDIHFSVFKKFPLASIELRNVLVKTPSKFEWQTLKAPHADTLLYAKQLYLQLNLRSILSKEYQLEKISVNKGFIQILTDRKGTSSLDIFKKTQASGNFKANISSFSLDNVELVTKSLPSKSQSMVFVKKGSAAGEFSQANFYINLKGSGVINEIRVRNDRYLPYQTFAIDAGIKRNGSIYTIQKGEVSISNIPMKVVGSINNEKETYADLIFSANNASLKQIEQSFLKGLLGNHSLEPKSGTISLQSTIKGYLKTTPPAINAGFVVRNGKLLDKETGISFHDIFLDGEVSNSKNQHIQKSLKVEIDSFYIQSGNSYQSGKMVLSNLTHPKISAELRGILNTNDINRIKTFNDIVLHQGSIQTNLRLTGYLPDKKSGTKSDLTIKGKTAISGLRISFNKLHPEYVDVSGVVSILHNQAFHIDSLKCQVKSSDFVIRGKLFDINMDNTVPQFTGNITSRNFIVTDFIPSEKETTNNKTGLILPDSIRINSSIQIDNFVFNSFNPKNLKGNVVYHNKKLKASNISMQSFSGRISGDTEIYQYANSNINLKTSVKIQKVNLEEMFLGFNNFNQNIINNQHLNGSLTGLINYSSTWDYNLKIQLPSINAHGNLLIENGELKDYAPIMGLSKFIEVDELKHIYFQNLKTSITIRDRKIILDQTNITSSAISFSGSGIHDFDNKYSYRLQVGLSDILWKKAKKKKFNINEFGYVVDDGTDKTIVPFLITGKGTAFDVKYDKRTSRASFKEKVEEEKALLRDLFKEETVSKEDNIIDSAAETKEPEEKEKPALKKTDSGTYQHKTNEFMLEWDDSEEEDDGGI